MNAIINKDNDQYRMSIIYDTTTHVYILIFSSVKDNKGEQYTCASYADAVKRFYDNCRFYGLHEIPRVPLTEEEFLGLNPGTLYPTTNNRTANNRTANNRTANNRARKEGLRCHA